MLIFNVALFNKIFIPGFHEIAPNKWIDNDIHAFHDSFAYLLYAINFTKWDISCILRCSYNNYCSSRCARDVFRSCLSNFIKPINVA